MQETFMVSGMTCASCSGHVEKAVRKLPGISRCDVNLMLGSMIVEYDKALVSAQNIVDTVTAEGYGARRADDTAMGEVRRQRKAQEDAMASRLIWSIVCLVPLFYLGMGHMLGLPLPRFLADDPLWLALGQLVLCLPILLLNRRYFTVGFSRLFRLQPNMDSLVALGASAGLIYSFIEIFLFLREGRAGMPELYFESAGMILTLVSVGKYLEERSKGKTTAAMESLLALAPESAVIVRDGAEITIPLSQVCVGDTVLIRAGGRIGVDGAMTAGQAGVDESAVTGESLPVEKLPGDALISGTVVTTGYVEMKATRVGEATTLRQIVKLMEETAASKAPISRLADQISAVFVPVVMGLALLATILWLTVGHQPLTFALPVGIAVLVISCPCALGLATPVAITAGTGKAARYGILVKSAAALEQMGQLDTVILDKTGTVTCGKPRLTDILPAEGITEEELLCLAASVEAHSEHPLGRAVVEEADRRHIPLCPVTDFRTSPGSGVAARVDGSLIYAGSRRFMVEHHVELRAFNRAVETLSRQGKTLLYFAENEKILGMIAVADAVKEDSASAVAALKERGHKLLLLTGDNLPTACAIAAQVGIDDVRAQVLPRDKAMVVAQAQKNGAKVAMVGDGINDAPALQQADVGFAIGAGTDIAAQSADVVLMKNSLSDLVTAVDLSRAVRKNIKGNLFWAFFYNAIAIPVAAGALYPAFGITLNPMLAAACMSLSSVCVCTNALRLRNWTSTVAAPAIPIQSKETKEELPMTKTMTIKGMMCAHCSGRVEKALNDLPGVTAAVDLEAGTAAVTGEVSDDTLRKAVTDAGYEVVDIR